MDIRFFSSDFTNISADCHNMLPPEEQTVGLVVWLNEGKRLIFDDRKDAVTLAQTILKEVERVKQQEKDKQSQYEIPF